MNWIRTPNSIFVIGLLALFGKFAAVVPVHLYKLFCDCGDLINLIAIHALEQTAAHNFEGFLGRGGSPLVSNSANNILKSIQCPLTIFTSDFQHGTSWLFTCSDIRRWH
jgi:hypothetical protein